MKTNPPRILIGAFRGGSGKTLVTLGMLAHWRGSGSRLAVFKKGPDYIDAAWISAAADSPCYNLDSYLMGEDGVARCFSGHIRDADMILVEGNRGLFDGVDAEGSHSSAALAKSLGLSVFLVVDCTKSTRTVAALLKGCQVLDPDCRIRGVILNQVANVRHEAVIRASIDKYCGLPVLGAIPRVSGLDFSERHLGLLPPAEHASPGETIGALRDLVRRHVDLEALRELAVADAAALPAGLCAEGEIRPEVLAQPPVRGLRMGVFQDASFHFYYPENLDALRARGVEIVSIRAAEDSRLPDLDALYIGGGFPESCAQALADNTAFRESVKEQVEKGLPVYAECGGAIYLGKGLMLGDRFHPFAGVFPVVYRLNLKPQGHGYTLLEVTAENPIFPCGTFLKGHEFHYAGVHHWEEDAVRFACKVKRGYGFDGRHEGLCYKNVYATFSHLHARGESLWAEGFLNRAVRPNGVVFHPSLRREPDGCSRPHRSFA